MYFYVFCRIQNTQQKYSNRKSFEITSMIKPNFILNMKNNMQTQRERELFSRRNKIKKGQHCTATNRNNIILWRHISYDKIKKLCSRLWTFWNMYGIYGSAYIREVSIFVCHKLALFLCWLTKANTKYEYSTQTHDLCVYMF